MSAPVVAVIEDDHEILEMMDRLLRDAGFRVISYTQGKDGHQFILRAMPDVVILDLWLEDCSAGSMVLGLLEHDPATSHIPILVCSAHIGILRDWTSSLQAKGYDLLQKPFDPSELIAKLRTLLEPKERPQSIRG